MSESKRLFVLVVIMAGVSLVVGGIAITVLYRAALDESRDRLVETAQSQARLIEAIARFDRERNENYPEGWESATLTQIVDAHDRYRGFGQTGEFTLARLDGDNIVFLLSHRHDDLNNPRPVPFASELAEPMRRALLGQSGTVIGLDYRGAKVVAAHEPVAELDVGIVAKIDLAEVRSPFIRAGLFAAGSALVVILLASASFIRISSPILRRLHTLYEKSQQELADRKQMEQELREARDELEQRVRERTSELETANRTLRAEIKERQRVEDVLRTQSQIISQIHDSVVSTDLEGYVTSWNEGARRLFGYAPEEALGRHISFVYPEDRQESLKKWALDPVERTGEQQVEVRMRRRSGADFHAHLSLSLLRDRDGNLVGIVGYSSDITERKHAEDEVRANLRTQEALAAILRVSMDSISIEEFLDRAMEVLLSIPWVAFESRGGIWLVADGTDALELKTQRGMPEELQCKCRRLRIGECLCGRAASTREIIFADHADERHEFRSPQMGDHSHYCVPIVSGERLLGVVCLYLPKDHVRSEKEEAFLSSVASVLAVTVQRKLAETALRRSEERFALAVRGTTDGLWDWDITSNKGFSSRRDKRQDRCKGGEQGKHEYSLPEMKPEL